MAHTPSSADLIYKFILGMALVIGLLALLSKYGKGRLPFASKSRRNGQIEVISRQQLTKGASVAVVDVAGKSFLVGITPQGVSLLSEVDLGQREAASPSYDGPGVSIGNNNFGSSDDGRTPIFRSGTKFDLSQLDNSDGSLGSQWMADQSRGTNPFNAWMTKLDQLRELTVRKS